MPWPFDRLPPGALDRARLATMVFAVLNTIIMLPLTQAGLAPLERLVAIGTVVVIVTDVAVIHVRKRIFWAEPLLAGPLVFLFGLFIDSSSGFIGFAIGAAVAQTLYGSARSVLVRNGLVMIGTVGAAIVTVGLNDQPTITHDTPLPILLIVPALLAGFVRTMGAALRLLDQAGKREALLANVGFQLSGLTEWAAVAEVIDRAAQDLCEQNPGLVLLILEAGPEDTGPAGPDSWAPSTPRPTAPVRAPRAAAVEAGQAVIVAAYGRPDALIGTALPLAWLAGIDPRRIGSAHRCPDAPDVDRLIGHHRSGWFAVGLAGAEAEGYILAGTQARRIPDGILDTMRTLSTQHSLADANCRAHAELTHLAHHDQLTSTPNQRAFVSQLTAAIARAVDPQKSPGALALLIIDLDDFKQVNDTLGHHCGDELLIQIAERLGVAAGPAGIVSRFGGDEFAVLLTGLTAQARADEVAERILEQLQQPLRLSGGTVTVGGSVGLVGWTPTATAADLMRCADIAMYAAKEAGKNRVERFNDDDHGKVSQVRLLEEQLVYVVARDEIVLHYQPLIDLKTGQCAGAEALARWQHPDLGLLLPSDFMPVAERRGLMAELQTHVLRSACRQMKIWNDRDPRRRLRISVNVSSQLLMTPGFDRTIRDLLAETSMSAAALSLEFSESEMLVQELPRHQLAAIAALGVRIALDDAGPNNVSLANLRALKPHQLKIDCRPLNRGDSTATELLNLVMSVSRFLQLETVAKMVETADHLDRARDEGLTMGQGYYFGAPMPAEAFDQWLTESRKTRTPDPRTADTEPFSSHSG